MDRLKRLVSFRSQEESEADGGRRRRRRTDSANEKAVVEKPPRVQFQLGDAEPRRSGSPMKKSGSIDSPHHELFRQILARRPIAPAPPPPKTNLHRTRSRSVECLKQPDGRQLLRKSILKAHREHGDPPQTGSGSGASEMEFRSQTPPLSRSSPRSQSYYFK